MSETEQLKEAVFARRQILKTLLDDYGNLSVLDYIRALSDYRICSAYTHRVEKLCGLIRELYATLWSDDLIDKAVEKMYGRPVILTADHAGMLVYPVYIQGNTLFGLHEILEKQGVILNFFSGLVPLDTASIPGGMFLSETYHKEEKRGDNGEDVVDRVVNANLFFYTKRRMRHYYAYDAPGYEKQKVDDGMGRIASLRNRGIIDESKARTLRNILNEHVKSSRVQSENKLIRQAALINRLLFKRYFPEARDTELLSFQLEQVAAEWLCRELKKESSDSLTVELLLNPSWRAYALKEFNGINPSCWHFDDHGNHVSGTFLFWGIDESGRAIKLREENGALVGGNGFSMKLTKEEILQGLSDKKIVPNIFVVFSVLAFEIGLSCFGGFMQCWYLQKIKDGWLSLLSYFGLTEEANLVKTVPVTNYVTGLTMLMFERDDGTYLPDGADIINRGGIRSEELVELSKTTMEESFLPALPFIYRSIFGADAELNHIDTTAVLEETNLRRKLVLPAPI